MNFAHNVWYPQMKTNHTCTKMYFNFQKFIYCWQYPQGGDCYLRLGIFGNFAPGYLRLISGGILGSRKLPLLRKSYTHCMISNYQHTSVNWIVIAHNRKPLCSDLPFKMRWFRPSNPIKCVLSTVKFNKKCLLLLTTCFITQLECDCRSFYLSNERVHNLKFRFYHAAPFGCQTQTGMDIATLQGKNRIPQSSPWVTLSTQ